MKRWVSIGIILTATVLLSGYFAANVWWVARQIEVAGEPVWPLIHGGWDDRNYSLDWVWVDPDFDQDSFPHPHIWFYVGPHRVDISGSFKVQTERPTSFITTEYKELSGVAWTFEEADIQHWFFLNLYPKPYHLQVELSWR